MKHDRRLPFWSLALWVGCLLLLFPRPASAYLDPGTGSMLWQVLLAGALTLGYLARRYWSKIRRVFGKDPAEEEQETKDDSESRQP